MKKTIYILNIGNYAPEITALTYPRIEKWAKKINAEIVQIIDRKYPDYPVVYEKMQIWEIEKERNSDWIIYIDSDCLVHPDMFDVTELLTMDTVLQHGNDLAVNRFTIDDYFRRDGRYIGTCNWFTVCSKWCLELFKPADDLTLSEMLERMHATAREKRAGKESSHLIDDFVLSRNLAKYGLKYKTLKDLLKDYGRENEQYFFHEYLIPDSDKVEPLKKVIERWGI